MVYLESFNFPSQSEESGYFRGPSPTYLESIYPFQVMPSKGLEFLSFSDVTILCGGNGSGKSTVLNIIAARLELKRESMFNTTEIFDDYVEMASEDLRVFDMEQDRNFRRASRIITSDDVFNHILGVRKKNDDVDFKRQVIQRTRQEYRNNPSSRPREINFDDPESVRRYREYASMINRHSSFSDQVRRHGAISERTYSNGENGYKYFTDAIQPGGLYLLDEPENSLSAQMQMELCDFITGMARFYDCQFIISTHSPFILSMKGARIYDMDSVPVKTTKWTEIPSVRIYHDFFMEHEEEFK